MIIDLAARRIFDLPDGVENSAFFRSADDEEVNIRIRLEAALRIGTEKKSELNALHLAQLFSQLNLDAKRFRTMDLISSRRP